MNPEIAHFALILCLPIALLLSFIPLAGAITGRRLWMQLAPTLVLGQWLFLLLAFIGLTIAFLNDDFTVKLVAMHSNSALPWYFKFSAVWGNHEGSLLLWVFILASWTLAVAFSSKELPLDIRARVLSVLGMISVGFLLFIIFTSNPFERLLLAPVADGQDLNPLLQDFGLIVHPPILYIGYVGFSVAFAFAIATLMTGKLDAAWARWSRPWTNTAWAFLTIGIALGSWWAYYELGWGGWWFWDPVENAAFMPWLAGTALIHSLAATEKRGVFRSWTVLLAIMAFSLSLLGTFLVRSGILVSVHAFASDPSRGLFILAFLIVVIGGSLLLYAVRAPAIKSTVSFSWLSRETMLLVNNILLAIALSVVLLGTLFPLVSSALDLGSYSVGPPYFNGMFLPIMILMVVLMGFAPYIAWKRNNSLSHALPRWMISIVAAVVIAAFVTVYLSSIYQQAFKWTAMLTVTLSLWLIFSTAMHWFSKAKNAKGLVHGIKKLSLSYWGMCIAHAGIAVTALGIGLTSIYEVQRDVRMLVGDDIVLGAYRYQLVNIQKVAAANYTSTQAEIAVYTSNSDDAHNPVNAKDLITTLYPEKRFYHASRNMMTEAGIDAGIGRDLYVVLGDELEAGAWAVRVHINPFVRCIWLGTLMMAFGGFIAVADKRYRKVPKRAEINLPIENITAETNSLASAAESNLTASNPVIVK